MFKITKISVAVKNATKEEKTFAKVTTKINDKDAVAYYLNSLQKLFILRNIESFNEIKNN